MAPTVRRLRTVEAFAAGKRLDAGTIDAACRVLEQDVSPIDDIRSTREYRLEVSRRMLRAFLTGRP
jgi:carbon-monoxide dehydrogenase medium subunit